MSDDFDPLDLEIVVDQLPLIGRQAGKVRDLPHPLHGNAAAEVLRLREHSRKRLSETLRAQHVSGSGYSTPNVSTVTFFMAGGVCGLSFQSVGTFAMRSTASMPSVTFPNAA